METALSIIAIVTGICFAVWIAVLILRFVDRLTVGKPPTQEEHERQRREFEARLARPQWSQLISHFGCDIPPAIERLYADTERLHRDSFYVVPPDAVDESEHHFIARFEPADLATIRQACLPRSRESFPFASDDFGNYYFVDLTVQGLCVHYVDHDGGDVSTVAGQLDTFLNWQTYSDARRPT